MATRFSYNIFIVIIIGVVYFLWQFSFDSTTSLPFTERYGIDEQIIQNVLAPSATRMSVDSTIAFKNHFPVAMPASFIIVADRGFGKSHYKLYRKATTTKGQDTLLVVEPTTVSLESFINDVFKARRGTLADHITAQQFVAQFWDERQYGTLFALREFANGALLSEDFATVMSSLRVADKLRLAVIVALLGTGGQRNEERFFRALFASEYAAPWFTNIFTVNDDSGVEALRTLQTELGFEAIVGTMADDLAKPLASLIKNFKFVLKDIFPKDKICTESVSDCANKIISELVALLDRTDYSLLLILDGVDEVPVFNISTGGCGGDARAYRNFVQSLAPLVSLAASMRSLQVNFYLPNCHQFRISEDLAGVARPDKVPVKGLAWDSHGVRASYADHVLKTLGEKRSALVKNTHRRVPTFSQLVGGEKCAKLILQHVKGPRHINQYISNLVQEAVNEPYGLGDRDCRVANEALRKASQSFAATSEEAQEKQQRSSLSTDKEL